MQLTLGELKIYHQHHLQDQHNSNQEFVSKNDIFSYFILQIKNLTIRNGPKGGDTRQKFWIKSLKETDLNQAFLDP